VTEYSDFVVDIREQFPLLPLEETAVKYSIDCLNRRLVKWAMCKYKRFRGHRKRAEEWLKEIAKREPKMFAHWALGMTPKMAE
jgi:hypothetical protein